jgi:hypothetical protein
MAVYDTYIHNITPILLFYKQARGKKERAPAAGKGRLVHSPGACAATSSQRGLARPPKRRRARHAAAPRLKLVCPSGRGRIRRHPSRRSGALVVHGRFPRCRATASTRPSQVASAPSRHRLEPLAEPSPLPRAHRGPPLHGLAPRHHGPPRPATQWPRRWPSRRPWPLGWPWLGLGRLDLL